MRKGIYRTREGNAAYISGPCAHTAFDLDMGERIPISEVKQGEFIRKSNEDDLECIYHMERGCHYRVTA
jgi:hypothetical protein